MCNHILKNQGGTITNLINYIYVGRICVGFMYVVDIYESLCVFCCMERKAQKLVKKKKDPNITRLAERIRDLRIARGYKSSEAFALDHHLSRTHYGRWERGSNITYLNLLKLAEAFEVSLEEFFGDGF